MSGNSENKNNNDVEENVFGTDTTNNNVDTNNATNNVFNNEDLLQLLDSEGGSYVRNVQQLDEEDFSNCYERPSEVRDTKIAALILEFNASKALESEKVQQAYTMLKILLNDLENKYVKIPQAEDSDSNVEEDTRSSQEFLTDMN
ncbi:hypothetical protein Tco_1314865 [Tanacetum coccineum]